VDFSALKAGRLGAQIGRAANLATVYLPGDEIEDIQNSLARLKFVLV
jgi:hypothetical protein